MPWFMKRNGYDKMQALKMVFRFWNMNLTVPWTSFTKVVTKSYCVLARVFHCVQLSWPFEVLFCLKSVLKRPETVMKRFNRWAVGSIHVVLRSWYRTVGPIRLKKYVNGTITFAFQKIQRSTVKNLSCISLL